MEMLSNLSYRVMQNSNKKDLKEIRQHLRSNGTAAEAVLWNALKGRRLDGWKWRRQFSVGDFILDFYCPEAKLAIELDGQPHYTIDGIISDDIKTEYLEETGIKVVRFENRMLREMPDVVLAKIRSELTNSQLGL